MKALGLQRLRIADINAADRLRVVDEDHAQLLAQNMTEVGRLRQPIEVRKTKKGFVLIAGGHRLRAAQILGWEDIDAFVFDCTDDEARMAEIDENLVRHELNPLDRAVFLWERQAIYVRLHPETKAGVAGGKARQGSATDIMSFAADVAARCGLTERTIRRATFISTKLAADVRASLAGTHVAKNQAELLALAKLGHGEQRAVLAMLLGETPKAKTVKGALRTLQGGHETDGPDSEALFLKLMALWGVMGRSRPGREAQRQFVAHLRESGALDTPTDEKGAA